MQVAFDEGTDEFSAYFNGLTNPKVLITTSDRPRGVSGHCLAHLWPICVYKHVAELFSNAAQRFVIECIPTEDGEVL